MILTPYNIVTEELKRVYWIATMQERLKFVPGAMEKVRATLRKQGMAAAAAIEGLTHVSFADNAIERVMQRSEKSTLDMLIAIHQATGVHFAREAFNGFKAAGSLEAKRAEDFEARWIRTIRAHVASKSLKVKHINETSAAALKKVVKDAIASGASIPEIAREIRSGTGIQETYKHRSMVIARTEVISASNFGSQEGARSTGLTLKKNWLATRDDRTREDHREADGQTRNLEDPYEVGKEALMYPGDPEGSPENVIQCRCAETYATT